MDGERDLKKVKRLRRKGLRLGLHRTTERRVRRNTSYPFS